MNIVLMVAAAVAAFSAGVVVRKTMAASNAQSAEARAQKMVLEAEREADAATKRALQETKEEIAAMRREVEEDVRTRREELTRLERRMTDAEEDLRAKTSKIEA